MAASLLHQPPAEAPWIPIAVVSRPFGVNGALRCRLLNPESQSLREGVRIRLRQPTLCKTFSIQSVCSKCCVSVREIQSREQAASWRGADVFMHRCELPALSSHELYLADLVNKDVYTCRGDRLGHIIAFSHNGAQPLVCIQISPSKKVQIPFIKPILRETTPQGDVILDPPAGLLETCDWS
ncbi:MAG: ribosome maturation factor RimM [Myxococcota bacterium]